MLLVAHRTPASAPACRRLADEGAEVFEVDVQLVGGRIAVTHYFPLRRTALLQRDTWRVRWHGRAAHDPGLAEAAAAVPADRLVLLDLKERDPARRAELLARLPDALGEPGRYRLCGAPPTDGDVARAAGLRTWRTIGSAAELGAVLAGGKLPDDAVTVRHTLLDRGVVTALHERVPLVIAWTVNGVGRARGLRGLGVDGVTTDRIAVLRALQSSR